MIKKFLLALALVFALSSPGEAACPGGVCYVRTDGGTSAQCNGGTDAAYDGSGGPDNCAFNHPSWVIPMYLQPTTTNMAGGDTLVIVSGTYRMGCQDADCIDVTKNISNTGGCHTSWPYDCKGTPMPDGTSGDYTTVIGCSLTGCGCEKSGDTITCSSTPPVLWSAGRSNQMISLDGSDYVRFQDIEFTDHADGTLEVESACATGDATVLSGRDAFWGNSGSNIVFDGVNIHGFCRYGMRIGGVANMSITDSIITRNGWSGWSLDSCADNGASGTCGMTGNIVLTNNTITWNGCTEDYPSIGLKAAGCHGQTDTIIADGIESGDSAGAWVVTGNNISWNTHDGSDLLYINQGSYSGGTVVYRRNRFEGNGGNPVKGPNAMVAEDNFIGGNCGFFRNQVFTDASWSNATDSCRGYGNAIEIAFRDLTTIPKIINNTIVTNGDVAIDTSGTCTTGTDVIVSNNIILGGRQFFDDSSINGAGGNDSVSIYFDSSGSCDTDFIDTYNQCSGLKEGASACNGTGSTDTVYPSVVGGTIPMGPVSGSGYYTGTSLITDMYLSAPDNGADETVTGADSTDFNNYDRGASWDRGAIEYGSVVSGGGGGGAESNVARPWYGSFKAGILY